MVLGDTSPTMGMAETSIHIRVYRKPPRQRISIDRRTTTVRPIHNTWNYFDAFRTDITIINLNVFRDADCG